MRVPLLGVSRHPRMFISAVLPAPDGPTIETNSPAFNGKIHSAEGADLFAAPPEGLADAGRFNDAHSHSPRIASIGESRADFQAG